MKPSVSLNQTEYTRGKLYLSNIITLMRKCLPGSFKSCNNEHVYFFRPYQERKYMCFRIFNSPATLISHLAICYSASCKKPGSNVSRYFHPVWSLLRIQLQRPPIQRITKLHLFSRMSQNTSKYSRFLQYIE